MKKSNAKKTTFQRILCLLLCITIITTGMPIFTQAADTAAETKTKFVKAEPEVFVPSEGEKTKITFNLESRRKVNIYIKDGKKRIANLVKNKEYKGGYTTHKLAWNGKDDKGNYVKSGTYKVIVEPVGKYKKYKSVTSVAVIGDNTREIYIAPIQKEKVFKCTEKAGKTRELRK